MLPNLTHVDRTAKAFDNPGAMESITRFLTTLLGSGSSASVLLAILIAYIGGVLSSLTPCIYPMIPITVSVVGGLSHDTLAQRPSWRKVLGRGLAYVSGMTVIYSFLGVAAGLTGKVFGSFTNTSAWYMSLGFIMTLAALTMMDVLPFDPQLWMNWVKAKFTDRKSSTHQRHTEPGFLSAFTLGASSGFIAAPCTTPVLTAILGYIAKTQSIGIGLALMIAFSAGLGTILILIAAFAGSLQVLPRSGLWMKKIKIGSGLILLGFAEYLFYRAGAMT